MKIERFSDEEMDPPSSPTERSTPSWLSRIVVRARPLMRTASSPLSSSSSSNSAAAAEKNQIQGRLFKYGPKPAQNLFLLVAFKTGDFNQQVIFVAGLKEGFLASEYLGPLSVALEEENWSLVQPLLSSSYTGYGTSSLEQDSSELDQLIDYLVTTEKSEGVILLGHSTGCQAPVSNRERTTLPESADMIDLAITMISEGNASELMLREAEPDAPITAGCNSNLFCHYLLQITPESFNPRKPPELWGSRSSDITDEQLKSRLRHMAMTPCQLIFSMADEQIQDHVDKKSLATRLCKAMGGAEKVEIESGNHTLSNRIEEAVRVILGFVKKEDDPWS